MKKLLLILLIFFSFSQISFADITEEEKIRWHLLRTENVLRKVNTTNLNANQLVNRLKNLDILHQYALDGKFPNNDKFPGESRPFFRGSNGNLCAVGFLMYQDEGYRGYVDNIVETNNLVEVMDIKEGKIFNWLDENGFTQLEVAMIQPTYGNCWGIGCIEGCPDTCSMKEKFFIKLGKNKYIQLYDNHKILILTIIILALIFIHIYLSILLKRKVRTKKYKYIIYTVNIGILILIIEFLYKILLGLNLLFYISQYGLLYTIINHAPIWLIVFLLFSILFLITYYIKRK